MPNLPDHSSGKLEYIVLFVLALGAALLGHDLRGGAISVSVVVMAGAAVAFVVGARFLLDRFTRGPAGPHWTERDRAARTS